MFKTGDKVICIKECEYSSMFSFQDEKIEKYKLLTVHSRRYRMKKTEFFEKETYYHVFFEEKKYSYESENFMLLKEYRKLKLEKLNENL